MVGRGVTWDRTGGESTPGLLWPQKMDGWSVDSPAGPHGTARGPYLGADGFILSALQEHSGCFVEGEFGTVIWKQGRRWARQVAEGRGQQRMRSRDAREAGVPGRVR